jgi:HEAT repeat protein/Uri superfamily endonuclease
MGVAGTYVLVLRLDTPQIISVGRLGEVEFPAGWYLYVGSAHGAGGLQARLARHRRRLGGEKRAHWHVDHLREHAAWHGAWTRTSDRRLECAWAGALRRLPGAEIVARGFGASDCSCPAHLVCVPVLPDDGWFADALGAERNVVGEEQLAQLLRTLATGDEEAREAAALALGRFGSAAIEPLARLLASSDAGARWWAARALAEVGGNGAVPPLVGVLADQDPDVRACAALALGRIGHGSAAPAVAARLADDSAFVAGIAADALQMIGEAAVGPLTEVLAYGDPHARLLAVRALGRIRSQSAVGPLFGALEDSSYLVRYYAQEALEALGVGMVFLRP